MNSDILEKAILSDESKIRDAFDSFEQTALSVVFLCDTTKKLLAVATEGDIRRALLDGHGLNTPLAEVANRHPKYGKKGMSREQLLELMSEEIYVLPILDEAGRISDFFYHNSRAFIPVASPTIGQLELKYVTDAILSGWVSSSGKYIDLFEEKFAAFCQVSGACAVSNGTTALHLALLAAGVKNGDEVILPSLTFISPANAIRYCGAKPIFVDVECDSWNINPADVEKAITPKTKAIIAVHLYGNPCRMQTLREIADRHGLKIIEDAAEAHGASIEGRPVGSWGDFACFSFFGNKILTTGEGGIVIAREKDLNERIRALRDHGMSKSQRYWHDEVGYNYRMTNMQAAIGVAQIERAAETLKAKAHLAQRYDEAFSSISSRKPAPGPSSYAVCWLYTLIIEDLKDSSERDQLIQDLIRGGIDTRPIFIPIPAMPPYFERDWKSRYPIAASLSARGISLPSMIELSDEDISHIAQTVIRCLP